MTHWTTVRRHILLLCAAVFAIAITPAQADQPSQTVATAAQLETALSKAQGGQEILLQPGDYGPLNLRRFSSDPAVTLRSADPADPARFSEMTLREVTGLALDNLIFDYTFQPGDFIHLRPFQILASRDITIRGALFDGDVARDRAPADDGFPTAFGLGVRNSTDIVLENTEIRHFFRGTVMSQSRNLTVRGNNLHSIRMDGMNFAEVQNVRIEGNHIHNFLRSLDSKDHADMIQFWTASTETPSTDILITGNILNSGSGWYTQSVFMRNERVDRGDAGPEMFYQNVAIRENVIFNAHAHGITLGETKGLYIENNSLIRNAGSSGKRNNPKLWEPRITVATTSRDVVIGSNVTGSIIGHEKQPDWDVENNIFVQDRSRAEAGFYPIVFVDPLKQGEPDLQNFRARKGSSIELNDAGASMLRP